MTTTPAIPPQATSAKPRRLRWLERATIAGILISVGVHLVLMLIAAMLSVQFNFGDAGGEQGEGVEFAILTSEDLAAMSTPRIDTASIETEVSPFETVTDLELLADFETDLSVSDLADSVAPSLSPGGGALTGIDPSAGSAGAGSGGGASFFGLEAQGTRFAYIVDRSGSMNSLTAGHELSRWELTRNELVRSIQSLDSNAEFAVELYSGTSMSLFGTDGWTRATRPNKVSANAALYIVEPDGSTHPLPALERVFQLEPLPDAVYLMTDGEFDESDQVPARIRTLNRGKGIPVHCILFGTPGGTPEKTKRIIDTMRHIARTTGGRFTHVREGKP